MSIIAITDYFSEPGSIEKEILGDLVGMQMGEETEILLVWHQKIDAEYCERLPNLRGVQRYGVGYDALDLDYLKSRGIVCCNNPDYGTEEVADTAVAMITNITRGVSRYNHKAKTYFEDWQENVDWEIKRNSETTIGIIGAGRIGASVLMRCKALRYNTLFYDPYKERGYEKMLGCKRVETLDELLENADIVSLHTPLNKETQGMVDQSFIQKMKKGASLVNTARGGLICELDLLYQALQDEHLANVALDVLVEEPPKEGKLINAWRDYQHPLQHSIIINPHTSYFSTKSYHELRKNAAYNALRIYKNEEAYNRL